MNTSEQIDQIGTALAKAQGTMKNATFDAQNPAFRSKYATLASIIDAIRGHLSANGIAWVQTIVTNEEGIKAATRLIHASGQWIEMDGPIIPVDKRNAHGAGSATTYAKRFGLAAAVGISGDDDDDGNAAAHNTPPSATHPEYESWLAAICDAPDSDTLAQIAGELAKSSLPAPLKSKLRAAFTTRKAKVAA